MYELFESSLGFDGLQYINRCNGSQPHEVLIAVKQQNTESLSDMLTDRSNPESSNYQQWLTFDEINSIINCSNSYTAVSDWLSKYAINITWSTNQRTYLKAIANISTWEDVLQTTFHSYFDLETNLTHSLTDSYNLPTHIHPHIGSVFNTCHPPSKAKNHITLRNVSSSGSPIFSQPSTAATSVTVAYLDEYYKIESNSG